MSDAEPIATYDSQSEQYRTAFGTFLQHTNQKKNARDWLERFIDGLPQRQVFIDAGAGTGQLTSWLAPKFAKTIAIEPSAYLCSQFRTTCPDIELLPDPINLAAPSMQADLVLCSHVFYYIPSDGWLSNLETMVSWLKPGGVLLVVLQNSQTDCMRMFHHFLGKRFDLWALGENFQKNTGEGYRVTLDTVPAHVTTVDFHPAYVVAEFMLNLLPGTSPPPRRAVEAYVSQSFADPQGGYRFSCHQDFLQIQKTL